MSKNVFFTKFKYEYQNNPPEFYADFETVEKNEEYLQKFLANNLFPIISTDWESA
jgi:hypothetical protein